LKSLIPTRRLIYLAVLIGVLLLLASFSPFAQRLSLIAIIATVLVAIVDASISWRLLDEVTFAPAADQNVVRLFQRRPGTVPLNISQSRVRARRLRIAVAPNTSTPSSLEAQAGFQSESLVDVPAEPRNSWLLTARPSERGLIRGIRIAVETRSEMALWLMRARRVVRCEIRVYPDLRAGRRTLLASPLYQQATGAHQKWMTGQGREFERLREYLPGDSYQDVSWKATARRSYPITRLYQWEQSQDVFIAIDHSRFSALSSSAIGRSHLDVFVETALLTAATSHEFGDRFGLITFTDRITQSVPIGSGGEHFGRCREALMRTTPERVTPDYEALLVYFRTHRRRRAFLLLLTNAGERVLAEPLARVLRSLRSEHVVVAQSLLPADTEPLFSRHAGGVRSSEEIFQRLAGHRELRRLNELRRGLMHSGVTLSFPSEPQFVRCAVEAYLEIKRRQLL
jgi:uncharacterized protein (DUF58 family)